MRSFAVTLAAVLLAGCISIEENVPVAQASPAAVAAPAAPAIPYDSSASRVASEQPAGAYTLDSRHSSVIWRVRHAGVGIFPARFDTISGNLTFDPANPANSSISVKIAANSVSTGVPGREGPRAFDNEIHTQAFGSVAHPDITFVSKSIALTSATTGTIVGDLTLRGVTKPVTIDANFEGGRFVAFRGKQVIGFTGRTMISRKDFGASLSNPMADGFVSDQVEIQVAAEFIHD
ncbi:MAG: YceI family protein [Hyphomonadaceae bacterium]|nr:YceI family protein [Hyphomonadaceae bacterium]